MKFEVDFLSQMQIYMLPSWAEQNVDPSLFSRELMANASYLVGDEEVVK